MNRYTGGVRRSLIAPFAISVWFALAASGADVSGIWSAQFTDRNGDIQDISFRFAQNGDDLAGKMYGDNESIPIANAKIIGNQITFTVTNELNGGITKVVYTGTINGNEIVMTRERVADKVPPVAKDKAVKDKPEEKKPRDQTNFVLKRVA